MKNSKVPYLKGYRCRIYPNKLQRIYLDKTFGCCRFVYNYLLANNKQEYIDYVEGKTTIKPSVNKFDLVSKLPLLKQQPEFIWLQEPIAQVLQQAAINLADAYQNAFKHKKGLPKFKNKHNVQSATFPDQVYKIENNRLKLLKLDKSIKIKWCNGIPPNPKQCVITKTKTGKYYASFVSEYIPEKTNGTGFIGVDAGITDLAIMSNGLRIINPRYYIKSSAKLAKLQRKLSRKQKGSKNRNKARIKVAKIHEKIANQRNDYAHKLTTALVRENQAIGIESLSIQNMSRNHKLAKHIMDAGWGIMRNYLKYKSIASQHCLLVLADPYYPSTQLCNVCGTKAKDKIKLGVLKWQCEVCDNIHERDDNASMNLEILARSYYQYTFTHGVSEKVILAPAYLQ